MLKQPTAHTEQGDALPRMALIRQKLYASPLDDAAVAALVQQEFIRTGLPDVIKPGQTIAIAVGSRGISKIALVVKALVDQIHALDATPFLVPAMGSHGGGTAHGQAEVLAALGITPEAIGCDIRSGTDVVELGTTASGLPVYLDSYAAEADGIIVVNRIKPHTDFRGPIESGLMKMIAIGLGKAQQARVVHAYGVRGLRDFMPEIARALLARAPILAGFALLEDGHHQLASIAGAPQTAIEQVEIELLEQARRMMPALPVDEIDILIVDCMGKNISGTGMDTNITGRLYMPGTMEGIGPKVTVLIPLDLSAESHGNAVGIGWADLTVRRLAQKIDFEATYLNALTGQRPRGGALPVVVANDRAAIHTAVTMLIEPKPIDQVRMIRIKNTLTLDTMYISEGLLEVLQHRPDIKILADPAPMDFDHQGNLF